MNERVIEELESIVGEPNLSTRVADLYTYGFDASIHHRSPEVIVRPRTTDEVVAIVKLAGRESIPIVPRGAGTGLCGSAVPIMGGIVMDMTRMNSVLEVRVADLYCVCEAGVVYDKLNEVLAPHRFFFPCAPGSGEACTIGGMVAMNASGMKAIKYGATRDYVMGLEVVLANGEVMQVGTRTLKNASGYQLDRLMVGSEGTLGIITKIILRVAPRPKATAMIMAGFNTLEDAGRCVSRLISTPLLPSATEIMDRTCIDAVNKAVKAGLPDCEALCLIEVDGDPRVVADEEGKVEAICQEIGAISVQHTSDAKLMAKWTSARKSVMSALSRYGATSVSVSLADDMAVPISRLPEAVVAFSEISKRNGIVVGTYGHAADGNLHTKMLVDPGNEDSWRRAEKCVGEIYDVVLELGGTVTGEHGVGITKAPYFFRERASAIPMMVAVKKAMDPQNILNPGKMMQWEGGIIRSLRYPCRDLDC
jgi:glycolate oxidase